MIISDEVQLHTRASVEGLLAGVGPQSREIPADSNLISCKKEVGEGNVKKQLAAPDDKVDLVSSSAA